MHCRVPVIAPPPLNRLRAKSVRNALQLLRPTIAFEPPRHRLAPASLICVRLPGGITRSTLTWRSISTACRFDLLVVYRTSPPLGATPTRVGVAEWHWMQCFASTGRMACVSGRRPVGRRCDRCGIRRGMRGLPQPAAPQQHAATAGSTRTPRRVRPHPPSSHHARPPSCQSHEGTAVSSAPAAMNAASTAISRQCAYAVA